MLIVRVRSVDASSLGPLSCCWLWAGRTACRACIGWCVATTFDENHSNAEAATQTSLLAKAINIYIYICVNMLRRNCFS